VFRPELSKASGAVHPKYRAGELIRKLPDGDWFVLITLFHSTIWMEKTDYRLSRIMQDPDAQ
jgi:hypothetical protein